MSTETTQLLFNYVVSNNQNVDPSAFSDWTSTSQLRLLQFYYSNHFAHFWLYRINHLLSNPIKLLFSDRNLSFLFPDKYVSMIEKICCSPIKIPTEAHISIKQSIRNHSPETIYHAIDPISINARLYEPFINMYHEKELPCRALVLEKGTQVYINTEYQSLRNRLNEGLSFQDLVERLRDCSNDYNISTKVSLFIDHSIDAGIIVPIVQQIGSMVFRAYRHGEDVLFGRREELMYIKMLSLYSQHSGLENGISASIAEKLVVLFSKVGLREKILHPYTSNYISEPLDPHGLPLKILRVKAFKKAPVALLGSALQHQRFKSVPYITTERRGLWLINVLIQNRCLKVCGNTSNYRIDESLVKDDISLLTEQELTFVQDFAELVGRISNPSEKTGVTFTDNDWSKVLSTLTLPSTIISVAAEMELFYNDIDIANLLDFSGIEENDLSLINSFTSCVAFQSVQNAAMKVQAYLEKQGNDLVKSVRFESRIEQRLWLSFFSEELNNDSEKSNEQLSILFCEQKAWICLTQIIINTIFVGLTIKFEALYNSHANTIYKLESARSNIMQASQLLNELKICHWGLSGDAQKLFSIFDQLNLVSEEEYCTSFDKMCRVINEVEAITNNIKEKVCATLGERGKINEILLYTCALHINLESCSEKRQGEAYSIIEKLYRKELQNIDSTRNYLISKGKLVPPMGIDELPHNNKPQPLSTDCEPGIWYIGQGYKIDELFCNFAINIFNKLLISGIECRITIFDRLNYDTCIKSSTSKFAEYHCNQFNTFMELFKHDVLFPTKSTEPMLIHVCPSHMLDSSKVKDHLHNIASCQMISSSEKRDIIITKTSYCVSNYIIKPKRRIKMNLNPSIDFGVITILTEELDALIRVFNLQKLSHKYGERIFYSGEVISSETGVSRKIICTQTLGQGELSVTHAYNDLVSKYHPSVVFLIGIAGGVLNCGSIMLTQENSRPEQDLCDVVIAKSVIDYELRKEDSSGTKHRAQVYNIDARVTTIVNDYLTKIHAEPVSSAVGSKNKTINVIFDAIGSGNAVIANELSSITKWLKEVNSKVAAVEMEATGISSSFYESALNHNGVQGLLVIRGISDLANVEKARCKEFRYPAAQNAAIISKQIMEIFPQFNSAQT